MSRTRELAVLIQKQTGLSLVAINFYAHQMVDSGLAKSVLEALQMMAEA